MPKFQKILNRKCTGNLNFWSHMKFWKKQLGWNISFWFFSGLFKSILGQKLRHYVKIYSFPVYFRFNFRENLIFIVPKIASLNFRASLFSPFWANTFIFAVIGIFGEKGHFWHKNTQLLNIISKNHEIGQSKKLKSGEIEVYFENIHAFTVYIFMDHVTLSREPRDHP